MNIHITDPNKYCFSRRSSQPYRQLRPFFKSLQSPENRLTLSLPKLVKTKKQYYSKPSSLHSSLQTVQVENLDKGTAFTPENRLRVKAHKAVSYINKRAYNEDRCVFKDLQPLDTGKEGKGRRLSCKYFAVFDGHGGDGCCNFLSKRMSQYIMRQKLLYIDPIGSLKRAFDKAEQDFTELATGESVVDQSGSCALVALLIQSRLFLANVGDSKCIGYYRGEESPRLFTTEHSPSRKNEYLRIVRHGGKIVKSKHHSLRIHPSSLNVSRTIGDVSCKLRKYGGLPNVIIHNPDVQQIPTNNLQYLLISTDGLFEGIEVCQLHKMYVDVGKKERDASKMIKIFVQSVLEESKKRAEDNMTLIMIVFE